jgi:succinate dehydrogenase / fumarate reductase iron-sulfur subunit
VFWNEGSYFGPAAIVNAHRFIFDSRDEAAAERLDILNESSTARSPARGHPGHQGRPRVKRALMLAR